MLCVLLVSSSFFLFSSSSFFSTRLPRSCVQNETRSLRFRKGRCISQWKICILYVWLRLYYTWNQLLVDIGAFNTEEFVWVITRCMSYATLSKLRRSRFLCIVYKLKYAKTHSCELFKQDWNISVFTKRLLTNEDFSEFSIFLSTCFPWFCCTKATMETRILFVAFSSSFDLSLAICVQTTRENNVETESYQFSIGGNWIHAAEFRLSYANTRVNASKRHARSSDWYVYGAVTLVRRSSHHIRRCPMI